MRKALFAAALVLLAGLVHAFEIGGYFDLSNLDFSRTRSSAETTLPGDAYLWGLTVEGRDQLSDNLALDLSYSRDTVLRNVAYTRLSYMDEFFSFTVGPFFGLLNSPNSILQSGLSTTVELFIPGITFVRLRSDNSLSGRLVVTGDYLQEQSEVAVGFYTANVIPTIYIRSKRYTEKTDAGETIDSLTAYGVTAEIYQKNVPYRIALDFAYQDAGRQFIEATTANHNYGSVVLGVKVQAFLGSVITAVIDLDSSIYTFGRDDLVGQVSADAFLFRLSTGVRLDLSAIGNQR